MSSDGLTVEDRIIIDAANDRAREWARQQSMRRHPSALPKVGKEET